jgi:hypothetical protein
MRVAALGWAAAAALLLAGCATDTTQYYTPPAGLTADQAVSIVGSKDPKFVLQSSEYHLVYVVDGLPVRNSAYRWDEPLLVTAGVPHRLGLAYGWGGIAGSTEVEFTGAPGSAVIVQGTAIDPDHLAQLWLVDARTGAVIGQKHDVQLSWLPSDPRLIGPSSDVISQRVIQKSFSPMMH